MIAYITLVICQDENLPQIFKLNAIKLGEEKRNVAQAARELGVKASLIHRRKREQQEIAELKKAIGEAKMKTEILKKAISVFSARDKRNLGL